MIANVQFLVVVIVLVIAASLPTILLVIPAVFLANAHDLTGFLLGIVGVALQFAWAIFLASVLLVMTTDGLEARHTFAFPLFLISLCSIGSGLGIVEFIADRAWNAFPGVGGPLTAWVRHGLGDLVNVMTFDAVERFGVMEVQTSRIGFLNAFAFALGIGLDVGGSALLVLTAKAFWDQVR